MKLLINLIHNYLTITRLFLLAMIVLLPQATNATRYVNYQSKTFVNPTINYMYVDRCLFWAKQCGQPAADKFCRIKGYQKAAEHKWVYKKPTLILGSDQVCNIQKGCGAFAKIRCVTKGASSGNSTGSGKIAVRIERKAYNCKQAGRFRHEYVNCRVSYSLTNTTNKPIFWSSGESQRADGPTGKNVQGRVGYYHAAIQPGKKEIMTTYCVIPKGRGHGAFSASGSGRHYGDSNKHRFKWRISMKCP